MKLLVTLLKAAHCRGTHHYFALDALPYVTSRRGKLLADVLLKHYDQYLLGAKDPDVRFRDFRNHVLHVADNDWGGAPTAAEKWYRQLIVQLDRERWSEAAYAAGVLSHYFTDPLMPLHTAQSEVESIVHRPIEWSISQSYARILKSFQRGDAEVVFQLAEDPGWLSHAVKRAARVSHRHYAALIRGYDLAVGVKRPKDGFDESAIAILAGLFGLAITGWARVLERAANDSRCKFPNVGLTVTTIAATIKMPSAWIARRIESSQERQAVLAIFDEFRSTGTVIENMPQEIATVRLERDKDRNIVDHRGATDWPIGEIASTSSVKPSGTKRAADAHLHLGSAIIEAPSIGPKTAKRFQAIGIDTIEQFLSRTPEILASKIKTSWISHETIACWQDQARLVCDVPGLCGYKAQLLVGVGCRSVRDLSRSRPEALHDRITRFALTVAGKRVLRTNKLPAVQDVAKWISEAKEQAFRQTA